MRFLTLRNFYSFREVSRQTRLQVLGAVLVAVATGHTPEYTYSSIWGAGLNCDDSGECTLDTSTGYFGETQSIQRMQESIQPQLNPVVKLTVLVLSSRLCMVVTDSPQHMKALTLANHIDYGSRQKDIFDEVCRNVISLEVNQRYNINASHSSNQDDPFGLSRTEDGLWAPGGQVNGPQHHHAYERGHGWRRRRLQLLFTHY